MLPVANISASDVHWLAEYPELFEKIAFPSNLSAEPFLVKDFLEWRAAKEQNLASKAVSAEEATDREPCQSALVNAGFSDANLTERHEFVGEMQTECVAIESNADAIAPDAKPGKDGREKIQHPKLITVNESCSLLEVMHALVSNHIHQVNW